MIRSNNQATTSLFTDKYEFTMLEAAIKDGTVNRKAVFELFARKLPGERNYGIVAGTERALHAIRNFKFTESDLSYLEDHVDFDTIEYLRNFKFTGTAYGYHEGDFFFPFSPVFTVESTFGEAVLLETLLLSIFNYDSAVATEAARIKQIAGSKSLQEFGARRVNEEAAVAASRAAYIAGWDSTSNMQAGKRYHLPVSGTSAHAFTLLHEDEKAGFAAQIAALGVETTLLVDTYDTTQGIINAVEVAGPLLGAIRIDSGDPFEVIPDARELLDSLGAENTRIIFSGDLDFESVKMIVEADLPVDGFGIGSSVVTGGGYPNCGFVYKLVEVEYDDGQMHPVAKTSASKGSVGGKKTAYRLYNDDWQISKEIITSTGDRTSAAIPIDAVTPQFVYYLNGQLVSLPTLEQARQKRAEQLHTVPFGNEVESIVI